MRGVRFNLVSPAGHPGDALADLERLAPRLRRLGWHVQWYVQADTLPRLVPWQAATGLPFVLDHLAGLHAGLADDHPAWAAVRALAEAGAWIKLSGWYRLGDQQPYAALQPAIERAVALFGAHTGAFARTNVNFAFAIPSVLNGATETRSAVTHLA